MAEKCQSLISIGLGVEFITYRSKLRSKSTRVRGCVRPIDAGRAEGSEPRAAQHLLRAHGSCLDAGEAVKFAAHEATLRPAKSSGPLNIPGPPLLTACALAQPESRGSHPGVALPVGERFARDCAVCTAQGKRWIPEPQSSRARKITTEYPLST
jgi:hypothetical protein